MTVRFMISNQLKERLDSIISWARPSLPNEQVNDMLELNAAGEPGIALENLSTQLYEYDVVVPASVISKIRAIAMAMGLSPSNWEQLASEQ
jgi:hypothetical protein